LNRIESADVFRTIAIIAVIIIHTTPFLEHAALIGSEMDIATVVNQISRFAVPFFFILSGYFWATKFKESHEVFVPTKKMAIRVAILFFAWSSIYLIPFNVSHLSSSQAILEEVSRTFNTILNHPLRFLFTGTKVHLWFLSSLLCSLLITAALVRLRLQHALIMIGIMLYLIGIAGKAYSETPIGFHTVYNLRNGPFFSTIFFVTGYLLQRSNTNHRWLFAGFSIAMLGVLMHLTELFMLNEKWGISMRQDYVFGTYFLGLGVALIALSNAKWLRSTQLASIGKRTLGIYASHFIFVDLLKPLEQYGAGTLTWDLLYVVLVFAYSYLLTSVLARYAITRKLVE
jgi:surface polysaccharide O-acyltransferase-like enzyme